MLKGVLKRAIALLLAFAIVIGFVPEIALPVSAATVDSATLGVDYLSITYQTKSENQYVLADAGYSNGVFTTGVISSGSGNNCDTETTEIIFNNTMPYAAELSFDYTLENPGKLTIDGSSYNSATNNGAISSVTISRGGNITIKLESKDRDNENYTKLTIKNISLVPASTTKQVAVASNNASLGTVSGGGEFVYQSTVTISAAPAGTGKFMGWYDSNNKLISSNATYSFQLNSDVNYTARFISTAHEAYILETGTSYPTLKEALSEAEANGGGTVSILRDVTIMESLTVPASVTLLVPCKSTDTGEMQYNTAVRQKEADSPFRTLVVGEGTTLTVEGSVIVNAVVGGGNTHEWHQITGTYGLIDVQGNMVVNSGGNLDSRGRVNGAGTITVKSGGTATDLFVVRGWRGGTYAALCVYTSKVGAMANYGKRDNPTFPILSYSMNNIAARVVIEAGGNLVGNMVMYVDGYMSNPVTMIGDAGLLRMSNGTVTRTHDETSAEAVNSVSGFIDKYLFDGDASLNSITMKVDSMTLSTVDFVFPISHGMHMEMTGGHNYVINENARVKFLYGSSLTVSGGSTLTLNSELTMFDRTMAFKPTDGQNPFDEFYYDGDPYQNYRYWETILDVSGGTDYEETYLELKDGATLINNAGFGGVIRVVDRNQVSGSGAQATTVYEGATFVYSGTGGLSSTVDVKGYTFGLEYYYANYEKVYDALELFESLGTLTDKYTTDSIAAVEAAVSNANNNIANPLTYTDENQLTVDALAQDILDAIDALEYTVTLDPNGGTVTPTTLTLKYSDTAYTGLMDPTRPGYTFDGWYNGTTQVMDKEGNLLVAPTKGNHTLTAKWTANLYNVTLNLGYDGADEDTENDILSVESVTFDQPYGTLPAPTRTGYAFDGWYTDTSYTTKVTNETTVKNATADGHTLYAKWSINQYTANFWTDYEGGQIHHSVTEDYGTTVELPIGPDKTGHTFAGWFYIGENNTWTEQKESFTMPESEKGFNLYARWTPNSYTVNFNANGGSDCAQIEVTFDSAYGELPSPTRQGYTFGGWYLGETKVESTTQVSTARNHTLIARWNTISYTIGYDLAGGSVDGTNPETYTVEDTFTLVNPTRTGYTFAGWTGTGLTGATMEVTISGGAGNRTYTATWTPNTDTPYKVEHYWQDLNGGYTHHETESFTGTTGASVTPRVKNYLGFSAPAVQTVTINADGTTVVRYEYTRNSYTITFMPNGGSGDAYTQTFTYGDGAKLDANAFAYAGYHFVGWSTGADNEAEYGAGADIDDELVKLADKGQITLYAVWEINTYLVVYDANGGTGETEGQSFVHSGSVVVQSNRFTRTGYSFNGWNTAKDGSGTPYSGQITSAAMTNQSHGETLTLYAQWKANTYTVTFEANGGTACDSITVTFDSAYGALPTPTKIGYDFGGWYLKDTKVESDTTVATAVDHKLTAKWIPAANEYTVEYYTMDTKGDYSLPDTQTLNGVVTEQAVSVTPEVPEGFELDNVKSILSGTVAADGSTVLKVYYSRNQYTVTWNVDGETDTETYYYGAEITVKADPSKEGHTFAGWTPEVSATMGAENVTYTATWTVNNYTVTWIVDGVETEETYDYGAAINKQPDLTKPGYTFTGWDAEVPAAMPAENLTFTAQWTAHTNTPYTVEHYWMDLNGEYPVNANSTENKAGTTDTQVTVSAHANVPEGFSVAAELSADVTINGDGTAVLKIYYARNQYQAVWVVDDTKTEVTYYYGQTISKKEAPTKTGYTFKEWSGYTEGMTMPVAGVTLTAVWTPISYTVTFHPGEGLDAESYTQTFFYDQTATLVPRRFNREGYAFVGWKDINGNPYDDQAYVFNWTTEKGTNFDLYAQWKADSINYKLEYYLQDVDGNGYTKDEVRTKTLAADMDSQTAVDAALAGQIEGFRFERADNIIISAGENNVVKVYYTRNPYTVTWDVDGNKTTGECLYGAAIKLPTVPTKQGYTFAEWQGYTSGMTMPAEDVAFIATWTPDEYAITYELDGGIVDGTNPNSYTIESGDFTLINPTKTGYTFDGWTWEGQNAPVLNVTVAQGSYGDRTYTANWTVNQYTITFVLGNGQQNIVLTQDYGTEVTAPENPAKTGYAFAGWDTEVPATMGAVYLTINAKWTANTNTPYKVEHYLMNMDGQGYILFETDHETGTTDAEITPAVKNYEGFTAPTTQTVTILPDGSLVVRYDYTRNQYDLTWKYDDGVTGDKIDQDIYFGAEIQMPEIPSRTGYAFAGWYHGDTKVEALTMPAANVTLTAKWTARSYEVAFHANGGTVNPISKTVTFDSAYGALPTPIRAGYVFAGWYTAAEGGTEVTADTVVKDATAGGHTLYARWTPGTTSYTIIHWQQNVADDDYSEINRQTIENAVTEATTAAEAWIFTGFTPQEIRQQTIAGDGSTVVNIYYDRNVHTLTWNANGGVLSGEYTSGQVRYGTAITVPEASRNGYTFVNWGAAVASTMPDNDLTYAAVWNVIPYTITYEGMEGAQNGNPVGYHVETATFSLTEPTKTGYTFLGWTWDGQTTPVKDVTIAKGTTGDRTFTANWEKNTYTVIFHANGGEGTMENQSLIWDDAKKPLAANTFTRKGYTFLGWALTENATAAVYADGAEVANLVSQGAVTLYAVWSLDTYTLGYTLNGGTVATSNPENYTVETDSFTLTNPTKTGYTFLGWTVNGSTEKKLEMTIEKGTTGNLQFEAHWQINTYTITFHSNGGEAVDAISREYQGTVLAADVVKPQREGYTFVAWYLDEALTKPVTYPVTMTADLNFYAKWTVNQYTITFMDTGDTVIDPIIQDYGTTVTKPANPTRTGYTFAGWNVEIPGTMPARDMIITAQWTVNQYTITFADTGDTVIDPITQDYGTAVTAPADPVRKGYTFAGWDVEIPAAMGAENITITALWTINQYSVTFDSNGGAAINPIKQNYLTQIAVLPAGVRAGYRFDGWFYANGTQVDLPITLEEDVTVVARWTSYLELLMAIDPVDFANAEDGGEDREILEQAREYFNLMKMDGEQLTKYQGSEEPYASHWNALEAEIREVALLELEHSIEGQETLDQVNDLLTDNGKAAATLDADPVTNYVDIWIEDPQREAAEFLTIPFLTTLLNNRDIWSIHFPAMEGESDNGTPLTPYGSGVDSLDQLNLMIRVAYATINTPEITKTEKKLTYNQFFTWLQQNRDITVGVLDGKGVTIVVNAKTPEGVEFSTTYVLAFYNRAHDVIWDVDGIITTETYNYNDPIVKPADPVKEGYTFTGWEGYTEGMKMGKENVTFKATWTINTYEVTWNVDGETTVVPYEYGAVIRLPEAPVKEGHSFTGWSGYTEDMTMPAGNLTFTAIWDVLEFTVTFNSDGGTEVESVTQDYGTQVGEPTAPKKTGYTFGGWYNGDTKVEFPLTMPAGGLELKAKWTINQYTITYVLDNGQENITITQDYNTVVAEPGDPAREGHTFAGWDKEIPAYMPAEDVTITAQWTVNQYTVTFVLDNGQADIVRTLNYGDAVVLPETPSKVGHSFSGWSGYTEGMTVPAGDVTITAQWNPNTYTVTLNADGGTVEPETLTVTYGQPYGLPTPTREGYTFDGWFHNGAPVSANVDITADATFVAQWTLGNPYNISYDLSGGNWAEGISPRVQYTVETDSFTLPVPTREGYTFAGWTGTDLTQPTKEVTVAKGSTGDRSYTATWTINSYDVTWNVDGAETVVTYEYGAVIELPTEPAKEGHTFTGWTGYTDGMTMPAGDLTFTAAWSVNQYTITFVQGNGQPDIVKTQNYGTAVTAPADPSREGYTFGGWDKAIPTTMPAENLVITAQWTINQYTITFVQGNGQPDIVLTQDYGATVTAPADPTREGYTFAGWDKAVPGTMPAENVMITAKWTVNRYTITFVQGNGEADILVKQDYGTAVTAPADPTREGYTFLGWDKEIPGTMPAGDLTITARWEINVYTITFDTAGGTAVEAIQDVYGAPITVPADPTREGYTFDGWNVEIPETMPAGDMTITAKWKVNTYTLTYLVDGEVYKTLKLNYGEVVVPELEPTKTGYTFSGWDQTAMLMPAHDVQISGTFTPNTYIVHFNANYPAAPAVEDRTVTFDSAYGTLPVVTRTGYTFLGWTLDGVTVTGETLAQTAGEHTLVAQWTPNTYKVTLVLDGGECDVTEITVTYDGTYAELPVPTREGYDFLGWFDGETQVLNSAKVSITADLTLTARWKATGNTPYTVEHYQQTLSGAYELVLTENLTGAADTLTQAQQQSFTGFHVNGSLGTASGAIQPDGSLVLKLYYDRNSYDVVWNVAGKQIRETYLYGQTLNVPDPAWAEDIHARYDFTGWDQELPETVAESATYNAQYSLYYEATIGSVTYRTLALALENAKSGETVRLARDVTVTENLTVPQDVLLLIPCKDDDNGYDLKYEGRLKFNYDAPNANGVASLYRTLTVNEGATLTIQGTVLLNSVSGRTTSGEQDITGGYGRMILNGEVIVADGGLLDCFGFITGTGKVTVQSGGTASDMYIVRHWRGGTQAYNMYVEEIYPMNEYDCRNIEVDVVVHYGGSYEGLVKMYAGNEYNYTRYPQVHVTNGLIRLTSEDGYVVRSYADGVETYKIYGGGEFANSALTILGVDLTTADFIYPIDGDIRYELYDGRYDIVNDYKFLPGSAVLVNSDASLHVAAGVTVVFYQEFNDVDNTGNTEYPAGRAPAVLTVRSGASFTNAGTFAGHIYTESPDIWIGVDPVWDTVTKEANGLAASLPDGVEAYVELQHVLSMERPGHTWHYGQDLSIVWDGYADYSAVQQAIASIPKDLDYYTPESVAAIQPAVDAVIYNLPYERQAEVDAMAIPIQEAVAGLVPRTITVILDAAGGSVEPGSITATCTMAIGTLPTPTREYHTFQGWFDGDDNRVTDKTLVLYKDDICLTAKWQIKPADNTALVRARRKVPADMSMYTEASVAAVDAALAEANYNLTADRQGEVNAMAQAILDAIDNLTYIVTLDANGGDVEPDTLEKIRKETDYAGLPTPTRRGYRFDGWFNAAGEQITEASVPAQGHHTLTARWTLLPADYTAVDEALALVPADLSIYSDETVAALQNAINSVVRGLMGDRQDEVDAMAQAVLDAINDLELYTILVTFDPNGGTVDISSKSVAYTQAYGELPVPEYPGHRFDGWFNAHGEQVTAETVAVTKDNVTLTAKWMAIPADYSAVDAALALIPADLTIYSDETAAAVQTAVDAVVRDLLVNRQDEVDAMAQAILDAVNDLELRTITVTLDPNGGTVDHTTITVTCTKTFGILPVPVYPGFDFAGWYTADGVRVDAATVVESREDLTLTARWVENMADYTTVENARAQIPTDLSIYSDETVAALNAAVEAVDYTLTADRQDEVDAMAQAILDAIANLKLYPVQVTFDANGGTVDVTTMTVEYTQAYGELPAPVRPGHHFDGWFNAAGQQVTAETIVNSKENVTLTARWTPIPADYSAVERAKEQIPADLSIYTDETVATLNMALDALDYTLTVDRQDEVDAMAQAILDAIAALEKKTVTVTTDDGNGNTETVEIVFGEPIGELPEPEDDCKIFLGWYNAEGEQVTEDTIIDSLEDMILTAKWQDICLEVSEDGYTMIVHYHGETDQISYVDVTVDPGLTVDNMTLRIPTALPTTRDASQAPLIHVHIPDGFKLRLEIPMDTMHYGNVVMKDNGDGTMELKKESVVWDYGLSVLVTASQDLRVVENSISFPDVADGFWAKDSIDYMSARRYLIGKTNGTYGVEEKMDRKMVVLVLWRLAGMPAHSQTESTFPDVTNPNTNYYDAIMWAYETGVTTGHGDGTFRPDKPITREQFAALMHRYAMLIESDLATAENGWITDFTDYSEIDPKMYTNIQWAMDTGLMNGHTDGTFEPDGETPRYQMSVVFFRFLQAYCKSLGN